MPESVKELRNYRMPEITGNPDQARAIMHTAGAAQVFAGPGSGKTYVIVHRIKHLITQAGIDPSHILVITFTKAAAAEMQERFFHLMEPERPPVRFGTFHAVFYHILRQSTQYRSYTIITESEKRKLIRQIISMHKRFAALAEEDMDRVIAGLGACFSESGCLIRENVLPDIAIRKISAQDMLFLAKEYAAYLEEWKQMDFDGIMRNCHHLLKTDAGFLALWQQQFQHILIDEFQDISPDQYAVIRLLAAPRNNLFIVGDDDQSIYGFRGASPDSMRYFMQDYPDADRIFLGINYRCGARIVEASGRVIVENRNRIDKPIQAVHERGEGFVFRMFETAQEQEEHITKELEQKLLQGQPGRCAMLCRTNYECAMWAQSFHKRGIPFSMKEVPKSRFRHFVIRDIMAYLALAQGERDRKYFLRIMNRPVRYLRRDCVPEEMICREELLNYYRDVPALRESVRKLFDDLACMEKKKLNLQIHYICKVIGYERYLREKYDPDEARELIGIAEEFRVFAKDFASCKEMNDYISQYEETLQELQHKMTDGMVNGMKGEEENRGICLMTMHASKGLEFDVVYIPDCQEGKIPYARSQAEAEIEEERRMLYVAMTRAKEELYLSAYHGKSGKDIPSRFIRCFYESSCSINSSNSAESRYSSKASATASYSSSSSI